MSAIAIITARGGSKRIPQKNIKDFCGKPIIAYSIQAAKETNMFDEVMVSTDSEVIKSVAEEYGAKVPFLRSASASNDYATTSDVIEEVLIEYEKLGFNYDVFCCIYPTAPFISAKKICLAMKDFEKSEADSLLTVVKYNYPPQRGLVLENKYVHWLQPEYEKTRSQDLLPIYHDCGQFYICKTEEFKKYKTVILPRTIPFIVKEEEAQDIDTMSDWIIAESKFISIDCEKDNN